MKTVYNICTGLLIGAAVPIALSFVLVMIDIILINLPDQLFHVSIGLPLSQLCILLIPIEMIGVFFVTRFNKVLAAATLPTAIIITAYLIYFAVNFTGFGPS